MSTEISGITALLCDNQGYFYPLKHTHLEHSCSDFRRFPWSLKSISARMLSRKGLLGSFLKMPENHGAKSDMNGPQSSDGLKKVTEWIPDRDGPNFTQEQKELLFDKWCDPENPVSVKFSDVSAAAYKIKDGILRTPCTRSNISRITKMEIFFKKEFLQVTGSFKERGARYTLIMLSEEQKKKGVICASAGNHALAISYHGKELGIPVTVMMPIIAPIMKIELCKHYGANVTVKGADLGKSKDIALKIAKERGLEYINGYDHPHILAGQGTIGLEILEQVQDIDAIMIPVGGGGLIAGIALAVKSLNPNIKIYGVESERCASFTAAMKAGQAVYTTASTTLADGLAVPTVGVNAYKTAAPFIDKMIVTGEEDIAIAILRLVEMEKAVVEGAGAAALAACLAGQVPELEGKRVVIPLCGGNIDTTVLGRCLERGLAADGRLVKFTVTVSDRPGGVRDLTELIQRLGISIKDIVHERAWLMQDIFSVSVAVVCETKDKEHAYQLEQLLRQKYDQVQFIGLSEPSYVRPKIETESVKAVVKGGKPVPMAGARRKVLSRGMSFIF
ncbi:L-threonine ammonia-lyase [Nymphon striatum]|nr:L-threonine ammonia-lyase [Nymphon striatum]